MLEARGASLVDVDLPHAGSGDSVYLIATAASSNLARYDGVRYGYRSPFDSAQGVDEGRDELHRMRADAGSRIRPEVKRRIMLGTYVLSAGYYDAYYLKASRSDAHQGRLRSRDRVDVVAMPDTRDHDRRASIRSAADVLTSSP